MPTNTAAALRNILADFSAGWGFGAGRGGAAAVGMPVPGL